MKRSLDVLLASALLLASSPVLLLAALAIRVRMGRPVLFRQVRIGLHARPFVLLKLRTMFPPADEATGSASAEDAARLTPLGRWLRATSIDELPQLWNVLRGEMSLVGPRPLLPAYLGRYTSTEARRHELRPGLTGLAQVTGRNLLEWDERLTLDVRYVEQRSFALDLWILWRTAMIVLARQGVAAAGHATMPEFRGSQDTPCATS